MKYFLAKRSLWKFLIYLDVWTGFLAFYLVSLNLYPFVGLVIAGFLLKMYEERVEMKSNVIQFIFAISRIFMHKNNFVYLCTVSSYWMALIDQKPKFLEKSQKIPESFVWARFKININKSFTIWFFLSALTTSGLFFDAFRWFDFYEIEHAFN